MGYNQNPYGYSQQRQPYYSGVDLKQVAYRHLTVALLIATAVVLVFNFIYLNQAPPIWLYMIGSVVEGGIILLLLFSALFRKQFSESTALIILNVFAVASSLTLAYMVNLIAKAYTNGLDIVTLTFGIAAVVTFGIYAYTSANKPDVSGMYKWVLIASIIAIVFALVGVIFFSSNPLVNLLISGVFALLFAVFMYMDFARLERREFSSPAMMALMLFYDIIYFVKELLIFLTMIMGERR